MPLIYMFQTGLRPGWKVGICHYQWLQNLWHSRSPRKARLRSSCMILLLPKTIGYSSLSSSFRNARLLFLLKPAQAKQPPFPFFCYSNWLVVSLRSCPVKQAKDQSLWTKVSAHEPIQERCKSNLRGESFNSFDQRIELSRVSICPGYIHCSKKSHTTTLN